MKIQLVDFRRAFIWLGAGWYAFKTSLGTCLALSITFLLAVMLLGMLPFVGIPLIALFIPLLLVGLLVTAHKSLTGALAQVEDGLLGFNDPRFSKPLLLLGAMMVAGLLLLFVVLYPLSGEIFKALYLPGSETSVIVTLAQMAESFPLGLLLQVGLVTVFLMAFFYATPLVVFEGQAPLEAVSASLLACLRNIVPLTLFGIMTLLLGILASFVFGLGYLVLIPVLTGASYASFRDVFDPVEPGESNLLDASSV
ncbi:hypothetical protein J9253_18470 [Thiothrix litoralis]|uniref:Transmembrane protein n=1 Tax=Thiothrix litoralis TaxID=2891210 RepID=A0ABX7WS05_9GAMM|nr:BPSS1780 family membrane protein [Thiothrix litoralis]QTR45946.1 hypothetical protein J9253_18470 [Thiothrix litoralis]